MKFIFPQLIFNIEKWKWNEEYQVYVSTLGHFKNKNKKNLPVLVKNSGYLNVRTPVGIKSCHRLVLLTWRPIPNAEDLTVDHLNHNKRDNSLNNLEWVTLQENLRRARKDYYNESEHSLSLPVKMEDKKFLNLDEAVEYLIKKENMIGANQNHIKNRILNAIKNNKKYCGKSWEICLTHNK